MAQPADHAALLARRDFVFPPGEYTEPEREILTGIGPVGVKLPKVRSRDGEPALFRSKLVPPYVRRTRSLDVALPWCGTFKIRTGALPNEAAIVASTSLPMSPVERRQPQLEWTGETIRGPPVRLSIRPRVWWPALVHPILGRRRWH